MLSLDTYLSEDKGFGFSTQEDPCRDLLEQYLNINDDPTPASESTKAVAELHEFDFKLDEETESSESCSANTRTSQGNSPPLYPHSLAAQRAIGQRPHRPIVRHHASRTAISSTEYLNLEGGAPSKSDRMKVSSSSSSYSAVPTLRRKGRFCVAAAEQTRGQSSNIIRKPSKEDSMSRPSYGHVRHESLPYQEWTQRFGQISLQQPPSTPQSSPSRSTGTFRDKRPSNILTSTQTPSHDRLPKAKRPEERAPSGSGISRKSTPSDTSRLITVGISPTLREWTHQDDEAVSPLTLTDSARLHAPPLRHAHTWNYSSVSPLDGSITPLSPGFSLSPTHVQPSWLHQHGLPENTTSYYQNGNTPSQLSANSSQYSGAPPLTPHTIAGFTPHSLIPQYSPYDDFINEDPSGDYSVVGAGAGAGADTDFPSHAGAGSLRQDTYDNTNKDRELASIPRPSTPPDQTDDSAAPLNSPLKRHLRSQSKLHRRSQKSLGHIKQPKSATSLKSPKSAGALRSPRSTGQFGFVNLGPNDKSKILTGVAPSGSSKTKARREQEAIEKKRRSSQAALKAVEALGGDVERLKVDLEIEEGMELGL
ncbi:hypothetical protein JMJ35_000724 [Cladonia borealis]|uniref:Developmental regulatory protein wetA n=1 Tax=Cladonia borealis TaxID=184061 RepID=A0AA39RBI6_9LECA|nr:hypothetical protein JMJ35_000724 [Cladonia borealis]